MTKKFLVTGDRHWVAPHDKNDPQWSLKIEEYSKRNELIYRTLFALKRELNIIEDSSSANVVIIHGAAKGVDALCAFHAQSLAYQVRSYPAMWDLYGRSAGPIRNREMLDKNPDVIRCLAFHDNLAGSKGTLDMCKYAKKKGLPVTVYKTDGTHYEFVLPKQTAFI